jgi:phosphoglycolate phosphatase/pyrophosphatase PpaX
MLKYPCLVLDHDDTVVQSETTINYPFFCYILDQFRPGATITMEEYVHGCCELGFAEMCRQWYQFTDQELIDEYHGWQRYIEDHTPDAFPGIHRIIHRQKEEGGLICVVSHSCIRNITRDYKAHFGILPDAIYGWDLPEEKRKPSTFPLEDIMKKYHLTPDQLLVVDDMKPAYEMASKAHVSIAFAGWGRKDHPKISAQMESLCDFSFYSTEDLERFLYD